MKTRLTLSALLIAVLPLAAQADNATERALRLNQAPLAPQVQHVEPANEATDTVEHGGGSAAMQKARAAMKANTTDTRFATSANRLDPARDATS